MYIENDAERYITNGSQQLSPDGGVFFCIYGKNIYTNTHTYTHLCTYVHIQAYIHIYMCIFYSVKFFCHNYAIFLW